MVRGEPLNRLAFGTLAAVPPVAGLLGFGWLLLSR